MRSVDILSETVRGGWIINGVVCDFVFWRAGFREKMPNGRKFRGGEFETLYRQLPIIRFDLGRNGISPIAAVIVDHVVKTINLRHPRLQLKVASLDLQSRPSAVFTVPNAKDASTALTQIRFEYEKRMAILEAKTSGRRRPAP